MARRSFSWCHDDTFKRMCTLCSEKFLPDSIRCWESGIEQIELVIDQKMKKIGFPQDFSGLWLAESQPYCISFGCLPKCDVCGKYMYNYYDVCIKTIRECSCRNCKPGNYRDDYLKTLII